MMATAAAAILAELKELGTEQNCKIYRRHGVQDELFGVSYGNLNALKKRIKVDHDLALALWDSGNHDARVLATMIADPKQADDALLDKWMGAVSSYVIADALSGYISRTKFAREKAEQWTQADAEWMGTVGWNLMTYLAQKDKKLPDEYFAPYLETIERDIHKQKNRVRYSMNNVVIALGLRNADMEARAIAAAERIGAVEVDHGETGCQTPAAVAYIQKANARKKK